MAFLLGGGPERASQGLTVVLPGLVVVGDGGDLRGGRAAAADRRAALRRADLVLHVGAPLLDRAELALVDGSTAALRRRRLEAHVSAAQLGGEPVAVGLHHVVPAVR